MTQSGGPWWMVVGPLLWSGIALGSFTLVAAIAAGPATTCVRLWNAPDNATVRTRVAGSGFRAAAVTAYTVDGPGRICYVTVFDRVESSGGSYVIWPDNLFDNGALHDYAGPFAKDVGYLGHELERTPSLSISEDGRIET